MARTTQRGNTALPDRYQRFMTGELKVDDLDDEELIRMQIKDRNGGFSGRPPLVIPASFARRAIQVYAARLEATLLEDLEDMYGVMREVAMNPRSAGVARIQAASYIIERLTGKIPDKSIVQQQITVWDRLLEEEGDTPKILMDLPPVHLSARPSEPTEGTIDAVLEDEDTSAKAPKTRRRRATR